MHLNEMVVMRSVALGLPYYVTAGVSAPQEDCFNLTNTVMLGFRCGVNCLAMGINGSPLSTPCK